MEVAYFIQWIQISLVVVVTALRVRDSIPSRSKVFSHSLKTGCESHPLSCSVNTGDPLPGLNRSGPKAFH
jgi:hypothetical protein